MTNNNYILVNQDTIMPICNKSIKNIFHKVIYRGLSLLNEVSLHRHCHEWTIISS